ncbi:MAG: hypothetical protein IK103_03290 [Bacteroidales bacterium]|nr:hypothetical protein [Bacteroidales bacterium]
MKKSILLIISALILFACSKEDQIAEEEITPKVEKLTVFHATTEGTVSGTKAYMTENRSILWNAKDTISVFNKTTENIKFRYLGQDGSTNGDFWLVPNQPENPGTDLDRYYAVFPWNSSNSINADGTRITVTLPFNQSYYYHSFGTGSNTMVAVSDDNTFKFKNVCGYLRLKLYGNNVKVQSIYFHGNNNEGLAGEAYITPSISGNPTIEMGGRPTDNLIIEPVQPVTIGSTAETYTDFYFVIPPVTFSNGFTITITDNNGSVFEKTTNKSITISRNRIESMAPLEVVMPEPLVLIDFDDATFKQFCVDNYDADGDGEVSNYEVAEVLSLEVPEMGLTSLKGISYFKKLTTLNCRKNKLTGLNVRGNTALTYLDCSWNSNITSLDVTDNLLLEYLDCSRNNLSYLDVSHNTELKTLQCVDNENLESLNVANNSKLETLHCSMLRNLTSLDVTHNPNLTTLNCGICSIESLDISHNPALTVLYCNDNKLQSLNLSGHPYITNLWCGGNQLESLNIGELTLLTELHCQHNQLSTLDISANTALTDLSCYDNYLTGTLDVSAHTSLLELHAWNYYATGDYSSYKITKLRKKSGQSITYYSGPLTNMTQSQLEAWGVEFVEVP